MKINEFITEVSKSKKQSKTMTAACKNAEFRKKVDIPKDVACDFHKADKGKFHENNIPDLEVGDEINEGMDDSWTSNNETITLQDILQLTASIPVKKYNTKKLASKVLSWDENPDEIKKIEQSNLKYPILIMVDDNEKIKWILDGNHRAQKALKNNMPTVSAKLIKLADLDDKARRILGEAKETLNPPSIDVGDEIKTGKFKNSKATVKGFKKDDHGQPVLKTNKGDKKLFNLRLSKLQETYQYAMRDEEFFTHEEYEKAQAELTAMGGGMYPSKAVREKYKPFGKLGTTTKPEQVMQHQLAGINKHDWAFSAQYSGYSEQECRICGKRRKVSAKGHDIRR